MSTTGHIGTRLNGFRTTMGLGLFLLAWGIASLVMKDRIDVVFSPTDAAAFVYPSGQAPPSTRLEWIGSIPALKPGAYDTLRIESFGLTRDESLIPGRSLSIDGASWRIESVRVWQGLLPVSDGSPMANVSILMPAEDAIENLLLRNGQRATLAEDLSIRFDWHDNEEQARRAAANADTEGARPRWGVVQGDTVNWFQSFLPGTGLTLDDGTRVDLVSFEPAGDDGSLPVLTLAYTHDGEVIYKRIEGVSNTPPVLLEIPPHPRRAFRIDAWESGHVLVRYDGPDCTSGPERLESGVAWRPCESAPTLRIEHVLAGAIPVETAASPFFEAVLTGADRRVRVRQGEALRVGDSLLRYLRRPDERSTAYRFLVRHDDQPPISMLLQPGTFVTVLLGGVPWRIAHRRVVPGESLVAVRGSNWKAYILIASAIGFIITGTLLSVRR